MFQNNIKRTMRRVALVALREHCSLSFITDMRNYLSPPCSCTFSDAKTMIGWCGHICSGRSRGGWWRGRLLWPELFNCNLVRSVDRSMWRVLLCERLHLDGGWCFEVQWDTREGDSCGLRRQIYRLHRRLTHTNTLQLQVKCWVRSDGVLRYLNGDSMLQ